MKENGAKVVSAAIIGYDYRPVVVNGKRYVMQPPTIMKIAGAGYWLTDMREGGTMRDLLASLADMGKVARALSWLIDGSEDLWEELARGTMDEVLDALETGFSMISAANFTRLSTLRKSVEKMAANMRP